MVYINVFASLLILNCCFVHCYTRNVCVLNDHFRLRPVIEIVGPWENPDENRIGGPQIVPVPVDGDSLNPSPTDFGVTSPLSPEPTDAMIYPIPPDPCTAEECYCPAQKNETDVGPVNFPKTPVGETVTLQCPFGFVDDGAVSMFGEIEEEPKVSHHSISGIYRQCTIATTMDNGIRQHVGVWKEFEVVYCRRQNVESIRRELLLMAASSVNACMLRMLGGITPAFILYAADDYYLAQLFIENVSKVLESEFMDQALLNMFLMYLEDYAKAVSLRPGYRIRLNNSTVVLETALFHTDTTELFKMNTELYYRPQFSNTDINISLPFEIVEMAKRQNVTPKLQITAYNSAVFSKWNDYENSTNITALENENDFIGDYRIISVKFLGANIENLTEPFVYTLSVNTSKENANWRCVYWDPEEKEWKSDGVETVILENEIQCKSTHLTAFSAILDPIPIFPGSGLSPITPEHTRILGILSSIGSSLSIAGLFMTTLTYGLFRCLRKDRSNRILFHLSLSLLLLHLTSVTSEKYLWNNKCMVPSGLLHYFLLTSLCWMLIEALHMFQLLISVFVKPEAHFLAKRIGFSWGCPLIIVTVCAGVHPEVYYEGRDDLCIIAAHLNLPLYYTAYLAPAVLILATNSFIFCRIASVLYKQGARTRKQSMMNTTLNQTGQINWKQIKKTRTVRISPTQIRGALTVMILVGVGWVFALFAIGPLQLIFKYLFVLCNAGQGVFIFIFRVALHPLASRTWRRVLLGISVDQELSTSSSFGNTNKRRSMQSFSVSPTFISASSSAENTLTRSDPMSAKLASNLASILRASDLTNSFAEATATPEVDDQKEKF